MHIKICLRKKSIIFSLNEGASDSNLNHLTFFSILGDDTNDAKCTCCLISLHVVVYAIRKEIFHAYLVSKNSVNKLSSEDFLQQKFFFPYFSFWKDIFI